jgi:hypothetical protein
MKGWQALKTGILAVAFPPFPGPVGWNVRLDLNFFSVNKIFRIGMLYSKME